MLQFSGASFFAELAKAGIPPGCAGGIRSLTDTGLQLRKQVLNVGGDNGLRVGQPSARLKEDLKCGQQAFVRETLYAEEQARSYSSVIVSLFRTRRMPE
jgi:hypothetical protein